MRNLAFLCLGIVVLARTAVEAEEWIQDPAADCPTCSPQPLATDDCDCLGCRKKLTGDWFGRRDCLAQNGITWDIDHVTFLYGVANGGVERDTRFGGHGDYVMNADMGKLGVQEGLFLKLRAEHRYGKSLGGATGGLLPPYVVADLPVVDSDEIYLTNVLITQALSENFAIFAGKLDTLDGDANDFAHRRGKDQFSNVAFVGTPIGLRTIPYATLGTGFVVLENREPVFQFSVLNPRESVRTSGFEHLFSEGVTLATELRRPTHFFGLLGHHLIGGTWSSRNYVALDQDPRVLLPSVPIARQSGSWSVYYNFDQYLEVFDEAKRQGWGIFGRAGVADRDTNPIEWFLSFGVGGNCPLAGRENDRFGAGWFIAGTSSAIDPLLSQFLGPIGNGQGVECFYNYEVTPWFHLTPDLQVVFPARQQINDSLLLGLRGKVDF